ncbi:MAG: AI-2E family transporter [Rhodocyclaceae bacterium]|nr:AI-2E family transporter [Rhodocyclaceae bacterium]
MILQDRLQTALWVGAGLLLLWLLAALSPILAPFFLAAILAYICNPLVDRWQRFGLPRSVGVLAVMLLAGAILATLLLIVLPLLIDEARIAVESLPQLSAMITDRLVPWLHEHYGIRVRLDAEFLRRTLAANPDGWGSLVDKLLQSLKIGGIALLGIVAMVLLTPVAMFYLLLDWHRLLGRIENAIPRAWHAKAMQLVADIDAVLSQFLRGQLLVMLILALYYSLALWLVGLPSAFSVGLLTGLLIFVPYVGYVTGLSIALIVATLQFQGFTPVIAVLVVYGIGQVLEGVLLTPYLVGERIGLHPLAVIFTLLAFGQLFGFVGVLLALPASAALLVGLREVRRLYLDSRLYRGDA